MCASACAPVSNPTTVPVIEIQSYASPCFITVIATLGFAAQLRCLTRPSAVFTRTCPSAASTHVIVACGEPSGFMVTNVAKFVSVSNAMSDSVSSTIRLRLLVLLPRSHDRDAELTQLFLGRAGRRPGERVGAGLRLGERRHISDRVPARHQHHQPVDPHRDAAVRGHPVPEGPQEVAELLLGLLGRETQHLEDPSLHVGTVDPDAPAPELGRSGGATKPQQTRHSPSGIRPSRSARCRRSPSSATFVRSGLSPTIRTRSPGPAPVAFRTPSTSSGDRCFSAGDRIPSSSTAIHTRPAAPRDLATCTRSSTSLRDSSAPPGAEKALMSPPESSTDVNARNPVPANTSPTSASSIPYRRSGLSEPY